jgi:hypothetical protein
LWLIRSPNLWGRCFCVAGRRYFKTIFALMVERRGADWKKYVTHVRFTSNPNENIAGFRPRGLKTAEDALTTTRGGRHVFPTTADIAVVSGTPQTQHVGPTLSLCVATRAVPPPALCAQRRGNTA